MKFLSHLNVKGILFTVILVAVALRCLMPAYLVIHQKPYRKYMISSSATWDMLAMSVAVAKGEGFHLEYLPYVQKELKLYSPPLNKLQRQPNDRPFYFDKGGVGQVIVSSAVFFALNQVNVPAVQFVQGVIDSLGCLLIFLILRIFSSRVVSLLGAALYAVWPASIFYSYHLMSEAYVPVTLLAAGLFFIKAVQNWRWQDILFGGVFVGLSFSFRLDNILVLPFYMAFMLLVGPERWKVRICNAGLVFLGCVLGLLPFSQMIPQDANKPSNVGVALYNSLAEYPANYKGLRFFHDKSATEHGIQKAQEYMGNDAVFDSLYALSQNPMVPGFFRPMKDSHLVTLAYIREVIWGKPVLFISRVISRTIAYFPANPFVGCIAYFWESPRGTSTMRNYRFSETFQLFKYFDFILFFSFCGGVWCSRKKTALLSLFCIYLGVLLSHVLLGGGEVLFRNDQEYIYLDPRYMLGMVTLWPIFIATFLGKILEVLRVNKPALSEYEAQ
ncbi:glycosyltransferase family 39 protein [Syntrophotalea acetylenivorans]|nr:glycosyltransferase family 39 protein [Syntrophotalea acetylenivorans]